MQKTWCRACARFLFCYQLAKLQSFCTSLVGGDC